MLATRIWVHMAEFVLRKSGGRNNYNYIIDTWCSWGLQAAIWYGHSFVSPVVFLRGAIF